MIFDSHYDTAAQRPYYEGIEKAEVLDPLTVKFTTKTKYFGNFESIALLTVIPKHIYGDFDKGPKINQQLIGSGPYILDKYEKGKRIVLKRNPKWWGWDVPYYKGQFTAEPFISSFRKENNTARNKLKKGDLDYMGFDPDTYTEKANGPEFGKTVVKVKIGKSGAWCFGYVGRKPKNPLFSDKNLSASPFGS